MASSPSSKVVDPDAWAQQNASQDPDAWAQANSSPDHVVVQQHVRKAPSQDWRQRVGGEFPLLAGGALGGGLGVVAGGAAGGVGAPVGGVIGAAGGGALVDQAQQAIARAMGLEGVPQPFSPQAASETLGKAGEQAAYQAIPEVLAAPAKAMGKGLVQLALKSTPEVAQTAIREGVQATKAGLAKTMNRIGDLGQAAMAIARRWDSRGLSYNTTRVAHDVESDVLPQIMKQAHTQDDVNKLFELTNKFLQDHGQALTNEQMLTFKRTSDEIAQPIWKKIQAKEPITGNEKVEYLWHSSFASQARDYLNALHEPQMAVLGLPQTEHTSMALNNATESQLIKLKQALVDVVKPGEGFMKRLAGRSVGPAVGASVGAYANPNHAEGAIKGALAGALATSPTALSTVGTALTAPMLAEYLRLIGRGGGALIEATSR